MAAWIFVLELESLDLNRKTKSLSPPFLLSCTAKKEKSPLLKPLDDSVKDINSVFHSAFCCLLLLNVNVSVKRINGLDRTFYIFLLTIDYFFSTTLVLTVRKFCVFVGHYLVGQRNCRAELSLLTH